jgi:hypothetical protein
VSLVAIVNLAQRLLNQTFEQGQDPTSTKQAKHAQANSTGGPNFEDQFTSSVASGPTTGQDAGLFNVQRFAVFSAAADFLLSQRSGPAPVPTEAQDAPKAPPNDSAAKASVSHQGTANPSPEATTSALTGQRDAQIDNAHLQAASLNGANQTPAPAPTEEVQAPQVVPQLASAGAQPNPQTQLQSLNNALANLGLSAADISIIDRIATLIQDFNPTAFRSLVSQLEGLARTNLPASAASPAVANTASATPSDLTTPASTNSFQIQELAVRFSAVNETLQSGNTQTGSTTVNFSAFNLQVEGISLTFTNGAGKTLQVEAPPNSATSSGSANSANTQAKAATV